MGTYKYFLPPEDLLKIFTGKTILVFDTETTGLFPHMHQITEIAAEVINGDTFEIIDSFHRKVILSENTQARIKYEKELIKHNTKIFSVEKCLKLNNYNFDDPDLQDINKVVYDFYNFCIKYNSIIVCQNAPFDLAMVNTALKRVIPKTLLGNHAVYDTKLFFSLFVIPALMTLKERGDQDTHRIVEAIWDHSKNRPSSKLGLILKAFSIEIKGWHGAPADVKSTVLALKKIMEFIKNHSSIVTDPTFVKERNSALLKELHNIKRNKNTKSAFYKKEKLRT